MDKVLCYSCNKSKSKLSLRQSSVLNINLLLCQSCIEAKYEPRWAVILSGRSNGHDHVRDVIQKKRYLGQEITASELLI